MEKKRRLNLVRGGALEQLPVLLLAIVEARVRLDQSHFGGGELRLLALHARALTRQIGLQLLVDTLQLTVLLKYKKAR